MAAATVSSRSVMAASAPRHSVSLTTGGRAGAIDCLVYPDCPGAETSEIAAREIAHAGAHRGPLPPCLRAFLPTIVLVVALVGVDPKPDCADGTR